MHPRVSPALLDEMARDREFKGAMSHGQATVGSVSLALLLSLCEASILMRSDCPPARARSHGGTSGVGGEDNTDRSPASHSGAMMARRLETDDRITFISLLRLYLLLLPDHLLSPSPPGRTCLNLLRSFPSVLVPVFFTGFAHSLRFVRAEEKDYRDLASSPKKREPIPWVLGG